MSIKLIKTYLLLSILFLFLFVTPSFATKFDLIPPSGEFQRGQDITFTINIDTEGTSETSIQSGLTYDSALLQYVSVAPGAAMNSVVADTTTYGTGKILLTGSNTAGFNGTGVFATVVFKIIAQSAGSTEICTLWLPEPSPTPIPTQPYATPLPACGSVCTSNAQCPADMPCYILSGQTSGYCRRAACPEITNCICPVPTAIPQLGGEDSKNMGITLATVFIVAAGGVFYLSQSKKYIIHSKHTTHKHIHKQEKSS